MIRPAASTSSARTRHPPAQRSAVDAIWTSPLVRGRSSRGGGEDPRRAAPARDEEPDAPRHERLGHVAGGSRPTARAPCAASRRTGRGASRARGAARRGPARARRPRRRAASGRRRPPAIDGRVVSSTSASWSPGSIRAGSARGDGERVGSRPAASDEPRRPDREPACAARGSRRAARRGVAHAGRARIRHGRRRPRPRSLPGFVTRIVGARRADEREARRRRRQRERAGASCPRPPRRARARATTRASQRGRGSSTDRREGDGRRVAPGRSTGSGETKPSRVSQTSPRRGARRGRRADEQVGGGRDRDRGHRSACERRRRSVRRSAPCRRCRAGGRPAGTPSAGR